MNLLSVEDVSPYPTNCHHILLKGVDNDKKSLDSLSPSTREKWITALGTVNQIVALWIKHYILNDYYQILYLIVWNKFIR